MKNQHVKYKLNSYCKIWQYDIILMNQTERLTCTQHTISATSRLPCLSCTISTPVHRHRIGTWSRSLLCSTFERTWWVIWKLSPGTVHYWDDNIEIYLKTQNYFCPLEAFQTCCPSNFLLLIGEEYGQILIKQWFSQFSQFSLLLNKAFPVSIAPK